MKNIAKPRLGHVERRILDLLTGASSLRGIEIAQQLAPISASAIRRSLVRLGGLGLIEQDRERRWSLPADPWRAATMRRLVRGMRQASQNAEISLLRRVIRDLRAENRRLVKELAELGYEAEPFRLEKIQYPSWPVRRGF
jgi:DNA-binding IclR family transcriptional regulator